MTKTLNLTGFQTGDNLSLSVSQGSLMAGPVNVPSWGGPTGGGTISINVERTRLQCSPDSVAFTVDLSASDFDTAGPGAGGHYNSRLHDLIYFWNFDDSASGDWSSPTNVLPQWKNRNVSKGPFVAHMYTRPGIYNPSVMVLEPSSGKMAQVTVSDPVVVVDPDTVYPVTQTICVNPMGDSDFSEAPAGALTINLSEITATTMLPYKSTWPNLTPKRLLMKRGAAFTLNFDVGLKGDTGLFADLYIGGYGSAPTKPVMIPVAGGRMVEATSNYGNNNLSDLRIVGLSCVGDFDPTVTVDADLTSDRLLSGFKTSTPVNLMVSEVDSSGVGALVGVYSSSKNHFHMDDCTATAIMGNYPVYMNGSTKSSETMGIMTGCRIAQTKGAHDQIEGGGGSTHALLRWNSVPRIHIRGCDFFHTDHQRRVLRLNSGTHADGHICNVHSVSAEGGSGFATFAGDPFNGASGLGRATIANAIFDGIIYTGAFSSSTFIQSGSSGMTVRNCLCIIPKTPRKGNTFNQWLILFSEAAFDPAEVDATPIKVYNNTLVFLREPSENNNAQIAHFDVNETNGTFDADKLIWENNIVHQPAYTPQVIDTYAPLTTKLLPWSSRNIGLREPENMAVLDTSYATPPEHVAYYSPAAGCPALGAALTGNVSYMDIRLKTRPEPPSIGAWEME